MKIKRGEREKNEDNTAIVSTGTSSLLFIITPDFHSSRGIGLRFLMTI